MYSKTIIRFSFCKVRIIIRAEGMADNSHTDIDNFAYHTSSNKCLFYIAFGQFYNYLYL